MRQALAKLILDSRRAKTNGKYPVKIRISSLRISKYFKTSIDLTEAQFEDVISRKPSRAMLETEIKLSAYLSKANGIIQDMDHFSFEQFERRYYQVHGESNNIFTFFQKYIDELQEQKRLSTASNYRCAMKSIHLFAGRNVGFYDVTDKFLVRYQQWMIAESNSLSTVGIYTRCLRTIFNNAISEKIIKREDAYPFGRRGFRIPAGQNIKKALLLEDVEKIISFQPSSGSPRYQERSRDLWLFSYFSNGMNFKDIANLRWGNFDGNTFRFTRIKTQKAEIANSKTISVYLNEYSHDILNKWGTKKRGVNDFVFDILAKEDDEQKISNKIYQLVQTTNKNMKRIFEALEIKKPHTTYVARHTFSTILKKSGASTEQLQEFLGHSHPMTTMKYLDSFDDDSKREISKALYNFKTGPHEQ